MSKRAADEEDEEVTYNGRDRRRQQGPGSAVKGSGEENDGDDPGSDFEGEFEDEWDSEDEVVVAGGDGLPDPVGDGKGRQAR